MRLINIETLKLEEFLDYKTPPYAILSHTWGDDREELTLDDIQKGSLKKPGIGSVKLQGCCQQAKKDRLGYIWIDTCCIDKTNAVELGEAINSMFRWYRHASVCYVYLSDVPNNDNPRAQTSKFRASRWFRRGWTLQELLAPNSLKFYDSQWAYLGTKGNMSSVIGTITGVPRQFLLGIARLDTASVAQRMSWAARRETKRKEDIAYCLLGIFAVTMPMIYGEGGDQAFLRLQEQIMRNTGDDSILAWGTSSGGIPNESSTDGADHRTAGRILATSPSDFAKSGHIVRREQYPTSPNSLDIVSGSLRVHLPLLTVSTDEVYGLLHCGPENGFQQVIGIPLIKSASGSVDEYVRPRGVYEVLQPINGSVAPPAVIYVKLYRQNEKSAGSDLQYWLYDDYEFNKVSLELIEVAPQACWHKDRSMIISTTSFSEEMTVPLLARFRYEEAGSEDFIVAFGLGQQDSHTETECHLMICSRDLPLEGLATKLQSMAKNTTGNSASNGFLHLHIALDSDAGQSVFTLIPKILSHPPNFTLNVSIELQKSQLIMDLGCLYDELTGNAESTLKLDQEAESKNTQLENIEEQQELLENNVRQLEEQREILEKSIRQLEEQREILEKNTRQLGEKRKKLAREKDDTAKEIRRINEAQVDGHERGERISKRWADVWLKWNGYSHKVASDSEMMDGKTPLQWAFDNGQVEMMELLLSESARSQHITQYQAMPWVVDSNREYINMARTHFNIIKAIATAKDSSNSQPPLICAAANGCQAVVELLLDVGKSDVNVKDKDGRDALSWAVERGHDRVILLLTQRGAGRSIKNESGRIGSLTELRRYTATTVHAHPKLRNWQKLALTDLDFNFNDSTPNSAVFSPDSRLLAISTIDKFLLWDTTTWEKKLTLYRKSGWSIYYNFQSVFSPDSRLLAVWVSLSMFLVWDIEAKEVRKEFTLPGSLWSCFFSADSVLCLGLLCKSDSRNTVTVSCLWHATTDQPQKWASFPIKTRDTAQLFPNLELVAITSHNDLKSDHQTVKLYSAVTGRGKVAFGEFVRGVQFSPDSKSMVLMPTTDTSLKIWDTASSELRHKFYLGTEDTSTWDILRIEFSPNSKLLIVIAKSYFYIIQIWNLETGLRLVSYKNNACFDFFGFSPDAQLYMIQTTKQLKVPKQHVRRQLEVWDINTGNPLQTFSCKSDGKVVAAFSPDSTHIVVMQEREVTQVWKRPI